MTGKANCAIGLLAHNTFKGGQSREVTRGATQLIKDFALLDPEISFERSYVVCIKDQTDDFVILDLSCNDPPTAPLGQGAHISAPRAYKSKAADE